MSSIHIYWDESHFWGLLVQRALKAWGVPHRLVRADEIAQGALAGKLDGEIPLALVVPGGRARGKMDRLGPAGQAEIRRYVNDGGAYVGFCGGAGLALSDTGLGLCPWKRQGFDNRLQHFLSGHVNVALRTGHSLVPDTLGAHALIPVWWPGQFAEEDNGVTVLATYGAPGPDFWVADLNLKHLPEGTLSDWEALYGIRLTPDFIQGRPCVITGQHGKGRYLLSYAHLETPASPQANAWLGHILGEILGHPAFREPIPAWDVSGTEVRWADETLLAAKAMLEEIIDTGRTHFLLFWRNPWLLGWRRGIPGAGINSLYSLICETLASEANESARTYWNEVSGRFSELMRLMHEGVTGYLLAERLAMTVLHSGPSAINPRVLRENRAALFGKPPAPGGLYVQLAASLEELYWHLHKSP
ncbi:BPL-N domain-containing protein [Salidesulfovibrio onnuriiensis]|uniref:BPL-N domain-containing protein n=1 Tax=Salidesulfovibrio onnuriiensis TaxID=2583823 RepID=UPI0011CB0F17|nr:BPL-N domain-containing protein [Salidesulfovibrio onnuriiensis]